MYWSSNGFSGISTVPYLRNKTAQARLLEHLRYEKPTLKIVSCPTKAVQSGRKRLKFPDPNNDCYVELELTGRTARVSLPVYYESDKGEDQEGDENFTVGDLHGLWYSLQLVSVRRFSLDGHELNSDEPPNDFFCYCPEQRKPYPESPRNVHGYWFRFFGEEIRFHVTLCIKLEGIELLSKDQWKDDPYFSEVCRGGSVSTLEFDIWTMSREQTAEIYGEERKPKAKPNKARTKQLVPYLYSNENYRKFIKAVQELKYEARYEELEVLLSHAIGRYHADNDLKAVVLLEQGLEACRKRYCDYAKELYKNAADLLNKCKNKALLTGRTYLYLSEVHFNEGCIGNAGDSLEIARSNFEGFKPCEDLGDLCFHEGLVLMVHAKRNQAFLNKLIPEARDKFLAAIKMYKEGASVDSMDDKLYCSYIKLASLELQPLPCKLSDDLAVLPNQVVTAQEYLDVVKEHIDNLSRRTKLYYYLCSAELALERRSMDEARENFNRAQEIAETDNLKNNVHVDIALEEIRRCLDDEFIVMVTPPPCVANEEKAPADEKGQRDALDGYLGDESS